MAARSWRCLALVASVLGTLGGAQGCTDDGVSLHVICPILPSLDDTGCLFEAAGDTCVGEGVLNLAVTQHYSLFLRVESGLKARSREVPPRGETNGIQIRSAEIELRLPSGEQILYVDGSGNPILDDRQQPITNPFTVVASGYVTPEGRDAVGLTIIDQTRGEHLVGDGKPLYPQIVASIKMKGVTNGAQEVEGGEYIWPIRLSNDPITACLDLEYCPSMFGQDGYARACP